MERARLAVDTIPNPRRRVRMAADSKDETAKDWVERALLRKLREEEDQEYIPPSGAKLEGPTRRRSAVGPRPPKRW